MTVVFTALTRGLSKYSGFQDAIRCAERFAGCPVVVLSDEHPGVGTWIDANPYLAPVEQWRQLAQKLPHDVFRLVSIERWLMLWEAIYRQAIKLPIFHLDWDVMLLCNVPKNYKGFTHFDFTYGRPDVGTASVAYGIRTAAPLCQFCRDVTLHVNRPNILPHQHFHDMWFWCEIVNQAKFKTCPINQLHAQGYWDVNMFYGAAVFEHDGKSKVLYWVGRTPYFKLKRDGRLVRALQIHCWGEWKTRTAEILSKATA